MTKLVTGTSDAISPEVGQNVYNGPFCGPHVGPQNLNNSE